MSLDSPKSREAHPQIGRESLPAATSSPSHVQDSLALEHCDLRGPQAASCRGEDVAQPSPLARYVERQRLRMTRLSECTNCGADVDTSFRSQCDECGSVVE